MKKLTREEALDKMQRYCAYQERCHQEVRNKLYEIGASHFEIDEIISTLITEGYLNEERFAKAFAGGKFRMKKWGRIKIKNALEGKSVSPNCIKAGLKEIDETDYENTLRSLLETKINLIAENNPYVKRDKLATYVIQKGYEPDLVWKFVKELVTE